jgi:hypothetical protein
MMVVLLDCVTKYFGDTEYSPCNVCGKIILKRVLGRKDSEDWIELPLD